MRAMSGRWFRRSACGILALRYTDAPPFPGGRRPLKITEGDNRGFRFPCSEKPGMALFRVCSTKRRKINRQYSRFCTACSITMNKLSVFITTYNKERPLPACLESVRWADEIIVLDSYSTDRTVEIAKSYGCRLYQHKFLGYGPQKQLALEHTANRYVLLLDADEMLSEPLAEEIRRILRDGPRADGYEFPRHEQLFWRMTHPIGRKNNYLRFFDKTKGRMSSMPVHAAPKIDGSTERLHEI